MERIFCRVLLFEGKWRRRLSRKAVEDALRYAISNRGMILDLRFADPRADVAFEIEMMVSVDDGDQELVSDEIIERLLRNFDPEYESMVEVEVE